MLSSKNYGTKFTVVFNLLHRSAVCTHQLSIHFLISVFFTKNSLKGVVLFLFDLILYVPVNNFSVMSGRVFLCRTSTKQGLMCLAQGHNAVTPVMPRSRVKHSTTEPLRLLERSGQLINLIKQIYMIVRVYRISTLGLEEGHLLCEGVLLSGTRTVS